MKGIAMTKKPAERIVLWLLVTVLVLAAVYGIGTGFLERTDVGLVDYSVSEDGTELTLRVAVLSSMGYVRTFRNLGGGVKPHYLVFYSTFGGFNSRLGAKHVFELDLSETDTEVYFCRPGGGYQLVLQKNAETGLWQEPN